MMKSRIPLLALVLGSLAFWNGAALHAVPQTPTTFSVTTLVKSGAVGLLNRPTGITADSKGNLYVADQGNNTIRKLDSSYKLTTIAGKAGIPGNADGKGTNATLTGPAGITADSQGNLYVADQANNTIRKIDKNMSVTTIAGQAGIQGSSDGQGTNATFSGPAGITADTQGNLYVADQGNNTIRKIDKNLNVTTIAGQTGIQGNSDGQGINATFSTPYSITSDTQGNLYVADQGNNMIREIDKDLNVMTIAGQAGIQGSSDGQGTNATFSGPAGITIDSQGNLYVADLHNSTIRKIDSNNIVTTIAGQAGASGNNDGRGTNATFGFPAGITADSQGNLYVTDQYASTIRKIDTNNYVTTIAGKSLFRGSSDGLPTNTDWFIPTFITADKQGNLYIADQQNYTVRKIDKNLRVTTIAGQSGVQGRSNGKGTNATFSTLYGITDDNQGNLYVADLGNSTIRKIDKNLNVTTLAGQTGVRGSSDGQGTNATFNAPTGITADSQGNLYVADAGNWTIRKIDKNLNVTTIAGQTGVEGGSDGQGTNATFASIYGIAADNQGNLYVADSGNNIIRQIDSNNNVTTIAGNGAHGNSDGQGTNATFGYLTGITADNQGNLYVGDAGNNTIREIDTNNTVTTIAGRAGIQGSSEGQGTNAIFNQLRDITFDGKGKFYISDQSTIRVGVFIQSGQTINLNALPKKTYGDASISLNPTASSGLTISYTSSNTKVAVVSGNTVTIKGAGSITITATQTGNLFYKAAAPVRQVLTVAKATQSLGFKTPPTESFVKGNTFTLSANPSSNVTFKSSNPHIISVNGTTATINAKGTVTITASLPGDGNYKPAVSSVVVTVQ
jgi:streptogramin lyase